MCPFLHCTRAGTDSASLCEKPWWLILSQHEFTVIHKKLHVFQLWLGFFSLQVPPQTFNGVDLGWRWSPWQSQGLRNLQVVLSKLRGVFGLIIRPRYECFSTKTQTRRCSMSLKNGVVWGISWILLKDLDSLVNRTVFPVIHCEKVRHLLADLKYSALFPRLRSGLETATRPRQNRLLVTELSLTERLSESSMKLFFSHSGN